MCQLVLVLLAVIAGYAGAATIERCCTQKMVGGVNYTLVDDTKSTAKWGCHSDCVFERVGMEGSRFCFKSGDLEVVCEEDYPGSCGCYDNIQDSVCDPWPKNNCSDGFSPVCDPSFAPHCGGCNCTRKVDNVADYSGHWKETSGFTPFDECFFPNSSYIGYSYIISTTSAANYTDCQQQCNQQKGTTENTCNFWNYELPVGSTRVSCTLMYNITSIESGLNGTYFRGPINENCPAHI